MSEQQTAADLMRRVMTASDLKVGDRISWKGRPGKVVMIEQAPGQFDGIQMVGVDMGDETVLAFGGELDPA